MVIRNGRICGAPAPVGLRNETRVAIANAAFDDDPPSYVGRALARGLSQRRRMRCIAFVLVVTAGCHPPGWDDGDDTASLDAAADDAAGSGDGAPADAAVGDGAGSCTAMFRLDGHGGASSVWLTGDFVTWAGDPGAGAITMALGGDSAWTVDRELAAGSYQYKFIVDGASWIADPANPVTVPDGFGGVNSVYTCY